MVARDDDDTVFCFLRQGDPVSNIWHHANHRLPGAPVVPIRALVLRLVKPFLNKLFPHDVDAIGCMQSNTATRRIPMVGDNDDDDEEEEDEEEEDDFTCNDHQDGNKCGMASYRLRGSNRLFKQSCFAYCLIKHG